MIKMTIGKSFILLKNKIKDDSGQSLIEIIIAISIFAMIFSSMISLSLGGFNALRQGGEQIEAEALAQEGLEAVISVRNRDWNLLNACNSSCIVSISGGRWVLSSGAEEIIGKYTRKVSFADVYRNASNKIVVFGTPGAILDPNSKESTSLVEWNIRPGILNEVRRVSLVTNWSAIPLPPIPLQADSLIVNAASASASGKDVIGITFSNSGSLSITISTMVISWTGGSGGNKTKKIRIDGSDIWTGNANSGNILNITDLALTSGATIHPINYINFSKNIGGATLEIIFNMSDGSQKIISGIAL
jgi:type II secretory pathway component PulJ